MHSKSPLKSADCLHFYSLGISYVEGEQKLFGLTFLNLEAISKARAFQSIKITRLLLNFL